MIRHACVLIATALFTLLFASCCLSNLIRDTTAGPPPAAADEREAAPSSADAPAKGPAEIPTPAPDEATGGRIAFSRDGNLYVLDLETREELEITTEGSAEWQSAISYGCPTFVSDDTLMFLKWTTDENGMLTDRAALVGIIQSESDALAEDLKPTGLGWSEALEAALVLSQTGDPQPAGDDVGATLTLYTISQGRRPKATDVESWFGGVSVNSARVRCSEDGELVSVPHFPTDVSDHYGIHRLDDGTGMDFVPEDWLGAIVATGVDFAGGDIYATFIAIGDGAPLEPGLYRVDLDAMDHELVASVDETNGLAVSTALGVAVVSTWEGALKLIDLETGKVTSLGAGQDPDIWPR